jgi:acetyl-CoA synthase
MTDEDVEIYYSCTLCQSFAPTHVCTVSPERTGLCGAYNWMDCKASYEINPTGPNQPIEKGECSGSGLGQWKGVNEFVKKASRGAIDHYNFYSMVIDPMTTCGCCECIAAMLPSCNGVMTVNRDYAGETPCGMKFTTLAGVMGGGASRRVLWATPSSTSPRRSSSRVTAACCAWSGCPRSSRTRSRSVWTNAVQGDGR